MLEGRVEGRYILADERRSSGTGPSLTAVVGVSGLLPRLHCSLGFILAAAAEPHFPQGATYLQWTGDILGSRPCRAVWPSRRATDV